MKSASERLKEGLRWILSWSKYGQCKLSIVLKQMSDSQPCITESLWRLLKFLSSIHENYLKSISMWFRNSLAMIKVPQNLRRMKLKHSQKECLTCLRMCITKVSGQTWSGSTQFSWELNTKTSFGISFMCSRENTITLAFFPTRTIWKLKEAENTHFKLS